MASFGKLYDFNVNGGVILAETSGIKSKVEEAFKEIFGADFSTDASTINGRLIEAITMMFKDVLGVNAQNVNMMNVNQAVGLCLDNIGSMLGIVRDIDNGESDHAYRKRIIEGFSRGSGFASSVVNAVSSVDGVTRCVVLDNGMEDPSVLPVDLAGRTFRHSIAVAPHTIMISVVGGSDDDIAVAIMKTKACGCGFTKTEEYGTPTEKIVTADGQTFKAIFYRPIRKYVKVSVSVSTAAYQGVDVEADAIRAIRNLLNSSNINNTITKPEIVAALAGNGLGIICTSCSIEVSDSEESGFIDAEEIVIPAYRYIDVSESDIVVTVE